VVSGGRQAVTALESSNPMTATSSGTHLPRSRSTWHARCGSRDSSSAPDR
jgi:hypothetical protein